MNGHELPAAYRVKDLIVLIPGVADYFYNQNEIKNIVTSTGVQSH